MEFEPQKGRRSAAAGLGALAAVALLWLMAAGPLREPMLRRFGAVNLIALALAVAVFLLLLLLLRPAQRWAVPERLGAGKGRLGLGLAACFALFLLLSVGNETHVFDAMAKRTFLHRYPLWLQCAVILLCAAVCLRLVRGSRVLEADGAREDRTERLVLVLLAGLVAYAAYTPNVFNASSGNLYHFHAYFNSIYQLFHGRAFHSGMTSIYGHYAFFFLPLRAALRCVGVHNEVRIVILALAALQGLSVLLYGYALRVFLKNRFVRLLSLAAVCAAPLSLESGVYVQTFPHRTFPYAVMAALLALWYQRGARPGAKRRGLCAAGYAFCALAVVWSTECGVVCALTWAALHCCSAIQEKGLRPWARVPAHLAAAAASAAGGYALTCCLNLLAGGGWIPVREFLFPMMTEQYMTGFLEVPLPAGPAAWMPITAALLFFLGLGVSGTALYSAQPQKSPASAVCFALAVLGLGTLTYAFNRPAYGNFYTMLPLTALLMGLQVQLALPHLRALLQSDAPARRALPFAQGLAGGLGAVALSVLMLLGLYAWANYGAAQEKRQPFRDEYSMECLRAFLSETAPRERFTAVGRGALEICASMGWDNGLPAMDYSDITIAPEHLAYADELLAGLDGQDVLFEESALQAHADAGLPGYRHFLECHVLAEEVPIPGEVSDLKLFYFVPAQRAADGA